MQLQTRPEPWMCMPLAFAMALDIPVAELLTEVGHDGSERCFPNLPEPACRRGFHVQEFIHIALRRGYAVTPVELFPVLQAADEVQVRTICYHQDENNNWAALARTVRTSRGVIDGMGLRTGHMVAYDHGRIFDPAGRIYNYSPRDCATRHFYSRCAWRIDPLGTTA